MGGGSRSLRTVLGAAAATLLFAPSAWAGQEERFAEPGGDGPNPCLESDPCAFATAFGSAPADSAVILKPGTYSMASVITPVNNVDIRGDTGVAADVVIQSTANVAIGVPSASDQTEIEDLTIDHTTNASAPNYGLHLQGGIARRVFVESGGTSDFACFTEFALLRDSVCLNNASPSPGYGAGVATGSDTFSTLTNVTAISTGAYGIYVAANAGAANPIIQAQNVIAEGQLADVWASALPGTTAAVHLSNSNFDLVAKGNLGGTETVTSVTEDGNQSDPELLDADFRQLPGSPTRNAGDSSAAFGAAGDIDGDERIQESVVDIGADEFAVPPTTTITQKPPKRTKKRKAKFAFTSNDDFFNTFECKLDSAPYADCSSPKVYRKLKRKKHTFKVRAVDPDGNRDPSPAKHTWKVKKKRS